MNNALFLLAVAYAGVAILDLVHTLAYTGMGVFPEQGANLATQFWIAARLVESTSLLAAAFLIGRRQIRSDSIIYLAYATAITALLVLIWPLRIFPTMYTESGGLTTSKIVAEYALCAVIAGAIVIFWRRRSHLAQANWRWVAAALAATVGAELSFTLYHDVYGFFNFLGHIFKLGSFVCIYKALVSSLLRQPYTELFRELTDARDNLQKQGEELRAILNTADAGICLVNEQGTITYASKPMAEIFRCRTEDLIGSSYWDYTHESERSEAKRKLFSLVRGEIENVHTERLYKRPDGTTFYGHLAGTRMLTEDGSFRALVGIVSDITESKQAERSLREANEFWQSTIDALLSHIAILDEQANIIAVNQAWRQFADDNDLGWPDYGVGRNYLSTIDTASGTSTENAAQTAQDIRNLLTGSIQSFELEYPCHSQDEHRWFQLRATRFQGPNGPRVVLCHVPITERKLAEMKVLENEKELASIYQSAPIIMMVLDAERRVCRINRAGADLTGSSPDELVGLKPGQTLGCCYTTGSEAGENCAGCLLRDTVLHTLRTGERQDRVEVVLPVCNNEGGTYRMSMLASVTPLHIEHEQYFLLTLLDITEQKQAEAQLQNSNSRLQETLGELRHAQQQLVDQERQRALTTMTSGIAHDFNNALSPIQSFTALLLDNPDKLEDRKRTMRYLRHIQSSANTAAETVRRMRKFYRPAEGDKFLPIDLNDVIHEAIAMTEPRWQKEAGATGKNIKIETDLSSESLVMGNEPELHEMLTNLIFNAVDAIPRTGTITIRTFTDEDYVVLEFADNGRGMSEEERRKCLDPFYTTKGPEGSGLGLATLQGTVERHNGKMTLESHEGEGTTFRIELPKADSASETQTKEQDKSAAVSPLKILVVEDEEVQREVLEDLLSGEGHTVEVYRYSIARPVTSLSRTVP